MQFKAVNVRALYLGRIASYRRQLTTLNIILVHKFLVKVMSC